MPEPLSSDITAQSDAESLARATATAKRRAREKGVILEDNVITISQTSDSGELAWRVNFGPKEPPFARGGDFMVDVDPIDGSIRQELWGQ